MLCNDALCRGYLCGVVNDELKSFPAIKDIETGPELLTVHRPADLHIVHHHVLLQTVHRPADPHYLYNHLALFPCIMSWGISCLNECNQKFKD